MEITDSRFLALGYKVKYLYQPEGDKSKSYWYLSKGKKQGDYEHRVVYELEFGPIPKGYIVHHKDGNGLNNSIDNLEIMSREQHMWEHGKKVYIDGVLMRLDEVMSKFNISDKGNCVRALKRYINKPSKRSVFFGHNVIYK